MINEDFVDDAMASRRRNSYAGQALRNSEIGGRGQAKNG